MVDSNDFFMNNERTVLVYLLSINYSTQCKKSLIGFRRTRKADIHGVQRLRHSVTARLTGYRIQHS